ncbi:hypothetical protein [uncultured Mediterranean phage uvMED]|nr:hypothetical protein [uncultured Mediterranean phage uvMED]
MAGTTSPTRITTPTPIFGKITSMRTILDQHVKPDQQVHTGPMGGRYIIKDDKRIYLIKERKHIRRNYRPRRGAYQRFVDAQLNV